MTRYLRISAKRPYIREQSYLIVDGTRHGQPDADIVKEVFDAFEDLEARRSGSVHSDWTKTTSESAGLVASRADRIRAGDVIAGCP